MSAALRLIVDHYHNAYIIADIELDYFREVYNATPWWKFRRRKFLASQVYEASRRRRAALILFNRSGFQKDEQ